MKTWKNCIVVAIIVIIGIITACDNNTTPAHIQPVAHAGDDQTKTLEDNLTITLDGTDSAGNINAYAWECVSYTADQGTVSAEYTKAEVDALIANANKATATVEPRKAGTYVFKLTVTDDEGGSDTDMVTVVVEGYTVTTTLDINSITFSSNPGMTLDFSLTYSSFSNPTDFTTNDINSCLTYTITVVNHDNTYTNTWNSTDSNFNGQILPRSEYGTDLATFTQTFYNNGQEKGTRVLKVMVANNIFRYFGDNYASSGNVPAINGISISRKITEVTQ